MAGKNKLNFVEKNFDIHGEFEGVVYHTKRNGEVEKYAYQPVSYYRRTPLTIRNEVIRRYAARVSNPRHPDYPEVIKKLNYYTPYILPAGEHKFRGETVFYLRQRQQVEFRWQGNPMGFVQSVSKRTMINLNFSMEGEFALDCLIEGEVYCTRFFIVSSDDPDTAYDNWLAAHIAAILPEPEPEYGSLKTYRRGMQSKVNWLQGIDGAFYEEVVYQVKDYRYKDGKRSPPWLYHRRRYDHHLNPQTLHFNRKVKEYSEIWRGLSEKEKAEWNRRADKFKNRRITGFNYFISEKLRL